MEEFVMKLKSLQIVLNITHQCNLKCDYCYYSKMMDIKRGSMSKEILSEVFKKLSKSSYEKLHICLHGGEPLTQNLDYFNTIISLHKEYFNNKKVIYAIQTNGTLINEEFLKFISNHNKDGIEINLGISIDGPEVVHDSYRITADGRGSFEKIMSNILLLDTYDIKYGVLSVLNDKTYEHVDEVYNFFRSLKNMACLDFIIPQYNKEYMPLKVENLSKLYISLFEKWYFDKEVNFDVRDFSALISAIAGEYGQGVCWMVPECIKNIHLISIDIKGDVAPCDNYTHVTLGNIMENEISDFMEKSRIRRMAAKYESNRISKCKFCKWYSLCSGGCPLNISPEKNESVYCLELNKIFTHINSLILSDFKKKEENVVYKANPYVVKIFDKVNKAVI